MRFVFWVIGLFAIAVVVGLAATLNTGYAILFMPPYRLEVSFNFLIVLVVALIVVVHLLLKGMNTLLGLPEQVRRYRRKKEIQAAQTALLDAGLALFEGRFQRVEKDALRALKNRNGVEAEALALLLAARAASEVRDDQKRDEYLNRLAKLPSNMQLPRYILEAESYLHNRQPLEALSSIEEARHLAPNLTVAIQLELQARLQLKQADAVLALTEKLLKADAIEPMQARVYRRKAYSQQLASLIGADEIKTWLKKIPEVERNQDSFRLEVIDRLRLLHEWEMAADQIKQGLNTGENVDEFGDRLGRIAPQLSADQRLALLKQADTWLAKHLENAMLLFALGALARAQQLWGKAQSYLEASLSLAPSLLAYAELASLFEAIDDKANAEKNYQACLAWAFQETKDA